MNLFSKRATGLTVFHICPLPENYKNFQIQSFFKLFFNIKKVVKKPPQGCLDKIIYTFQT